MEYTIPLQTITDTWAEALKTSESITAYCTEHFSRAPIVMVGGNPRNAPSADICPYIVLMNGMKYEGADMDTLTYHVGVVWAIYNPKTLLDGVEMTNSKDLASASLVTLPGAQEVDELGQLIYETLQTTATDRGWPISRIEYDVTPASTFPQFGGTMVCTTEITPSMGEVLTY